MHKTKSAKIPAQIREGLTRSHLHLRSYWELIAGEGRESVFSKDADVVPERLSMLQEISFTHIHTEESQRVLRREKKGGGHASGMKMW